METKDQTSAPADDNTPPSAEGDKSRRERSKIDFPYSDLEAAVDLINTLQSRAGTACEVTQLASWMNQSAAGGTFRSRVGAARLFGLVDTQQGQISITAVGREILDDIKGPSARADAFLRVPLYRAMYEKYQGFALPPAAAVERQMEQLGVPPKQKERARQTFTKSALFAGFVDSSTGRFIKPASAASPPPPPDQDRHKRKTGGGGGDDDGLSLDPLLLALLKKIPAIGESWPKEQRVRWFRTFAMNVSQIYDTDQEAIDLKIEIDTAKGGDSA